MPKRPSAIDITPDNKTILCGDKFGDVYAIPLLPTPEELEAPSLTPAPREDTPKIFVPSATTLTVHTGRNRKALEDQKKSAQQAKTKEPLKFAHELLLGHVSMLTDLSLITLSKAIDGESRPRGYILTSDRDEHIRISRGQPQAHIIEGFCLGHDEFVSRLCPLSDELLVSGGGDDHLIIWSWAHQKLLQKIDLRDPVTSVLQALPGWSEETIRERKLVVSGLWSLCQNTEKTGELNDITILAAIEGIPALIFYRLSNQLSTADTKDNHPATYHGEGAQEVFCKTIPLPGNILDVIINGDDIIISVDNVHEPSSMENARSEAVS